MTNGAVIFAQNSANLDYIKMAVFSAMKLKENLDIPVSLITDSAGWLEKCYPDHVFDKVISIDNSTNNQYKKINDGTLSSKQIEWKNLTRDRVYDLTPYDRTLVIDSDYIINSPVLKIAFNNNYDFQIYKRSMDLAAWRPTEEFDRVSQWSIPFYWATAFMFTKNIVVASFFDLVAYIKANWTYFRTVYSITSGTYRNDYAFSIAIHIMNGKTNGQFATALPGTMTYCTDKDLLIKMDGNRFQFLIEKENYIGQYIVAKTQGIDVHVMNKLSLCRCIDGGSGV